ncbi:hypothetical protein MMC14_006815 [Varicellaria rhodocarpa]|nr:hypothetical protein [Varicellaria rhodocarpa]
MGTARAPLASLNASLNTPDALSSTDKAPITSAKRQHSAIEDADDDDEENDAPQLRYVTDSCDQVRRKINTFINSGEMKVGEFQKAIGVNSRSYGTFMTQQERDQRHLDAEEEGQESEEDKKLDVSGIHLDGEENGDVEVYDTCDEVRRKIAAFLREPGVTQASSLREVSKMLPQPKKIQSKQLQGKKGALAGNEQRVLRIIHSV